MKRNGRKTRIRLIDASGVAENRAVTKRWVTDYLRWLARNGKPFTVVTGGGKIEFFCEHNEEARQ